MDQPEKLLAAFDFAEVMAEKEKEHGEQMRSLLLSFLEIMDSFDRFFAHLGEEPEAAAEANWLNTVRLIRKQVELALQKAGVTPIAGLGLAADPHLHEIVDTKETTDMEEGIIVEEVRRGYLWKDSLLRSSQVVIAKVPREV